MVWQCPRCKKLQHQINKCKFCGYKEKRKDKRITVEKLVALKKYKMPEEYWKKKRKA